MVEKGAIYYLKILRKYLIEKFINSNFKAFCNDTYVDI